MHFWSSGCKNTFFYCLCIFILYCLCSRYIAIIENLILSIKGNHYFSPFIRSRSIFKLQIKKLSWANGSSFIFSSIFSFIYRNYKLNVLIWAIPWSERYYFISIFCYWVNNRKFIQWKIQNTHNIHDGVQSILVWDLSCCGHAAVEQKLE